MRVIKLSIKEFPTFDHLEDYFDRELPSRNPPGKFIFTARRIAADTLLPGEKILFSYKCFVRFVAYAASGRIKNNDQEQNRYPYFFVIDLQSVRRVKFALQNLEDWLRHEKSDIKCIVRTQGWPKISDTEIPESVIESMINNL